MQRGDPHRILIPEFLCPGALLSRATHRGPCACAPLARRGPSEDRSQGATATPLPTQAHPCQRAEAPRSQAQPPLPVSKWRPSASSSGEPSCPCKRRPPHTHTFPHGSPPRSEPHTTPSASITSALIRVGDELLPLGFAGGWLVGSGLLLGLRAGYKVCFQGPLADALVSWDHYIHENCSI